METNDDNTKTPQPMYSKGDRVVHARPGMRFKAVVYKVCPADELQEALQHILEKHDYEEVQKSLEYYRERDPECFDNAVYVIAPDDWDKPASWEQAQLICPTLTEDQYSRIMGRRFFIVLETDIFPEEWEQ